SHSFSPFPRERGPEGGRRYPATMTTMTREVRLQMIARLAVLPVQAILLAALWLTTATAEDAAPAGPVGFSEAETRMWLTDQLADVSAATEFDYTFEKSGTLEPGFTDHVTFVVEKVNEDGTKAASLEFFSGERNFPVPPVSSTT